MKHFTYKNQKFILDPRITQTQTANGTTFRLISIEKNTKHPSKFINKMECHHYFYTFMSCVKKKTITFELDYNDNLISKI